MKTGLYCVAFGTTLAGILAAQSGPGRYNLDFGPTGVFPFKTLDETHYRFLDLGNPSIGAATIPPRQVFINTNGAYMTYSPVIGQAGPFGRFWTQGQFRGFILLHELGHELSDVTDFQDYAGNLLNQIQSQRVLAACF